MPLLLACCIQVVPRPLLDFSRSVMRDRFSAIVRKSVYTFAFNRFVDVQPSLIHKLQRARAARAVVLTTPNAIKSFALKFVEMCHILDRAQSEPLDGDMGATTSGLVSRFSQLFKSSMAEKSAAELKKDRAEKIEKARRQAELCTQVKKSVLLSVVPFLR